MPAKPKSRADRERVTSWATTPATRLSMQSNRSRDTVPERALRSAAHRLGLRFRVAARPLPELRRTADLVFSGEKIAVFLDGCYWHGCPVHHRQPSANSDYWSGKVARNRARDSDVDQRLAAAGWTVLRVWEHERADDVAQRLQSLVRGRRTLRRSR
jgi:DNA mismatch endonuclease, patch repair protein